MDLLELEIAIRSLDAADLEWLAAYVEYLLASKKMASYKPSEEALALAERIERLGRRQLRRLWKIIEKARGESERIYLKCPPERFLEDPVEAVTRGCVVIPGAKRERLVELARREALLWLICQRVSIADKLPRRRRSEFRRWAEFCQRYIYDTQNTAHFSK